MDSKHLLESYLIGNLDRLYRLAFSYTLNREDAEDVVNESVIKALQALNSLKEPKYLGTWLYRIVINTAISMKKQKLKVATYDPLSPEWIAQTRNMVVEESYEGIHFEDLMKSLNSEQRILLILRYFEEYPIAEIAEIMGENINTIKTHLYRTLRLLRAEMEGKDYGKQ